MSLAMVGVTHCAECWRPLKVGENGICKECEAIDANEAQKKAMEGIIERRVRQEVAKVLEKIETITIVSLDDTERTIQGYWKNDKFYYVGEENNGTR